jgi:hypothetical protein
MAITASKLPFLTGTITTAQIPITRNRGFDRIIIADQTDLDQNRILYYYSFDGTTYSALTTSAYTATKLGNKQATLTIPTAATYIIFRIVLQKRTLTSTSPQFNSLRFRYRTQYTLYELDPYFTAITIPAFLIVREQQTIEITQGANGWETNRPLRWWTGPEAHVVNGDVMEFLQGSLNETHYQIQKAVPHYHGPDGRLLHTDFESSFIRDDKDIIQVLSLLT